MDEKMKNSEVIEKFVKGIHKGSAGNLHIEVRAGRTALINYNTCIAERLDDSGEFYVNRTKYSKSTTVIQNKLGREIEYVNGKIVQHLFDIPRGSQCLV
jgi:hypothetical protein